MATFSNLTLAGTAGTNYTLTFAASGLTSAVSGNLTVTFGATAKLAITTSPAGGASGGLLATEPVVAVEDSAGNVVTSSSATISVTSSAGSTIGGSQAGGLAATSGVATFSNLTLAGTAGTDYTLTFAASGLTSAVSGNLTVTFGATAKLAITTSPAGGASGGLLATEPVVKVEDAQGNVVTSSGATISVTSSAGSTIGGSQAGGLAATSGVATFSNLTLAGTAGTDYTLTFAASGLTSAVSGNLTVTFGAASKAVLVTQPLGAVDGLALSTQPVVQLQDSAGNNVSTSGVNVVASVNTGSGTLGGTTTVATNASGVATFTNLAVTGTVGSYTLNFTPTSLATATSNAFTLTVGAASQAALTTQPFGAVDGLAFAIQPVVQLQDVGGNNVSTSGVNVVASVNTGSGTLGGTTTVATNASGVAAFTNLAVTGTVGSYGLTFTPTLLTPATSNVFTLSVGAASKIAVNAGNGQAAAPGTAVAVNPSVLVTDVGSNPVSGVSVTFAIGSGGGSITPTGGGATTNGSGIATVGSWTLGTSTGTNTLTATSGSLSGSPVTFNATAIGVGSLYGGGVVGYILAPGDPGYVSGQCHGLIAALTDQSSSAVWALSANQSTAVPGVNDNADTAIGTGSANTTATIAQNGAGTGYAAGLAHAYTGGSYSDWYLPSKAELNELYLNRTAINTTAVANGGTAFAAAYYWSSSEGDAYDAWLQHFGNGSQADFVKDLGSPAVSVRAVRSF